MDLFKRVVSLILALTMVLSMVPSFGTHVHAEELETEPAVITEAPTTEAPTTEAPTTEAPTTEAPTTEATDADVPTTVPSTTNASEEEPEEIIVTETETEPPAASQAPEESAVAEFQAQIDDMLDWYLVQQGGLTLPEGELTEEEWEAFRAEIEAVVANMSSDDIWMAQVEIYDLCEAVEAELTEEEADALAEANPALIEFADVVYGYNVGPNVLATLSGLTDNTIGLDGTESKWTVGTNSLNGSVTGMKLFSYYASTSDTLTITNNKVTAATLSFDFTATGNFAVGSSVTVDGTTYTAATTSSFSKELDAGGSITIKLAADKCNASYGANTISIAITNLSLAAAGTTTTTFVAPDYGSYTVTYGDTTETVVAGADNKEITNDNQVKYTMTATPGSGYKLVGWKNLTTDEYLSTDTTYTGQFDAAYSIQPIVVPSTTAVFLTGEQYFVDLDDAVTYATGNSQTQITLVSSGTISDPSYTIPSGITLLIPMDSSYTPMAASAEYAETVVTPSAYATLTLAANTKITVSGNVELEAKHNCLDGAGTIRPYGGRVSGPYGAIYMNSGSNITLNSGANLYAWGFIYGTGSVTALSGAKVYEYLQANDFPGGSNLSAFVDTATSTDADGDGNAANDYIKSFPLSQYYVQNIEVPLTLNYGAEEHLYATGRVSSFYIGMPVEFIGDGGMFILNSGCSLTKDYDHTTDRLVVDINGNATLNSLVLDFSNHSLAAAIKAVIGTTKFDSSKYILGLNSNITLNIQSGTTTIAQDVALLPGVEVYIDSGATMNIASGTSDNITVYGTGGQNLYVYDKEQWGNRVFQGVQLMPATYSPTPGRYQRTAADLKDVIIDVNGTIIVDGYLYTTVTVDDNFVPISGGASIISSGKTGVITMNKGAGEEEFAFALDGTSATDDAVPIASAWLKNGDGTYLQTAGAAAGTTYNYCATHDCWYTVECVKCACATVGHKPNDDDGDCTTAITCSVCGEVTTPAKSAHTPNADDGDCTTAITCSVCGKETTAAKPAHNPNADDGDCTTAITCSACGKVTTAGNASHKPGADDGNCTTAIKCVNCDKNAVEAKSHTDSDKDHHCDNDGCTIDQGTHEAATGKHTCDYCSKSVTTCADNLSNTAQVDSNCIQAGHKAYWTCSVCGKNYSDAAANTEIPDLSAWMAENGEGYIEQLSHNYTYTANDDANTITESCDQGCNHSATLTLTAPTNLTYDGKAKDATVTGTIIGKYELTYSQGGNALSGAPVNAGSYTATLAVGEVSVSVFFTINKADPDITTEPQAITGLIYNGEDQNLITAGEAAVGKLVYSLTEDGEYTETIPTGLDAGTYTVYYKVVADDNYSDMTAKSFNVTIAPKSITDDDVTLSGAYVYTGREQTVEYTVTDGVTYDVTGTAGTDAGTYTLTVTAKGNYTGTVTKQWTIAQKAVAEPTVSGTYTYSAEEQEVVLTGVESSMTTTSSKKATNAGTYEIVFTLDGNHKWAEGSDGKVQWTIAKAQAVITVDTTLVTVTYGNAVTLPTATSNFGSVSCDRDPASLKDAGTYTVTYSVAGTDNYEGAAQTVTVEIKKATVTITADSKTACVGTEQPALTYTVTGLVGSDVLSTLPTLTTDALMDTAGDYTISASGAVASNNYTITYVDGKLTVQNHGFDETTGLCPVCKKLMAVASAKIGETTTYYESLGEAISAVKECKEAAAAVVTLLDNIDLGSSYIEDISGVFTIDLNGKKLSGGTSKYGVLNITSGNVTITDNSANKDGIIAGNARGVIANDCTVTITGGQISASTTGGRGVTANNCTVMIAGGKIVPTGTSSYGVYADGSSTVTITGGDIKGGQYGVYAKGSSTVTITGGAISGKRAVLAYASEITINGGVINGTEYGVYAQSSGIVTITGGTITTTATAKPEYAAVYANSGCTVIITGGSINGDVNDLVTKGTLILGLGADGIGATFPGGITVYNTTLNDVLAKDDDNPTKDAAYWQGDKMIVPDEGTVEISGGDVVIKAACTHEGKSYTDNDDGATHTWSCAACQNEGTADHDYTSGTTEHTCVCGAVETFTVTFTVNGEVYGETKTVKFGGSIAVPTYDVPEGHTFSGWDVPATMPAENITLDATLTVNTYTVTFTINGVAYGNPISFAYGKAVTAPAYTVPEGHTFSGWDVPATMPAENITLNATLTVNTYTVTFTINGVAYGDPISFTYGAAVTAPEYATPEGHTFSGWEVPASMPAENITLNATLTVNTYTITLNNDGETTTIIVTYGQTYADGGLPELKREGYTFDGWFTGETKVNLADTVPAAPAETLTAKWTVNKYPATFNAGEGTFSDGSKEKTIEVNYGDTPVAPETPAKQGYAFDGWTPALAPMGVNGATYTATYAAGKVNYTVEIYTMDTNGAYGDPIVETYAADADALISYQPTDKTGFTLDTDASVLSGTAAADGSTVLKVYYIRNQYDITYEVDNVEHGSQTYYFEAPVAALAEPTKTGYSFSGWTGVPATMPAEDVTVTGTFKANTYNATFDANGGAWADGDTTKTVPTVFDQDIVAPEAPERTGYTFADWTPEVGTMDDVNGKAFTALWTATSYDITYDLADGKLDDGVENPASYTIETETFTLANPTREGYTFLGWEDAEGNVSETVTIVKGSTGAKSYTATWQINTYTVSLHESCTDVEIVSVNGDTEAPFTVEHGQELNAVLKSNTGSACTDVVPGAFELDGNYQDYGFTFDPEKMTMTISDQYVTGDVQIIAESYVLVTINLNGGEVTEDGLEHMELMGGTWDAENGVLKIVYGSSAGTWVPTWFQKTGHTYAGVKINGEFVSADTTIDFLTDADWEVIWKCDTLTKVPAKDATCSKEGNIAHYKCESESCGKLYSDESGTTELTEADVTIAIVPEAHAWGEPDYVDNGNGTHTATYVCGHNENHTKSDAAEGHDYTHDAAAHACICGAVETYTVSLYGTDWGVAIVDTPVATHGQELVVELVNNLDSTNCEDVYVYYVKFGKRYFSVNLADFGIKWENNTLTIPAGLVTCDVIIHATAYVHVTINLNGGEVTEDGLSIFSDIGSWNAETSTWTAQNRLSGGGLETWFQKTGYTCAGVKVNGSENVDTTMNIQGDQTWDVQWTPNEYDITWIIDGVTSTTPQEYNTEILAPAAPEKTGYTFTGWSYGENTYKPGEVITTVPVDGTTITLTSTWAANTYDAVFYADGGAWADGDTSKTVETVFDEAIVAPEDPERTGYTFSGWTPKVDTMDTEGKTFTAQWVINTYNATFDANGGAWGEETTKTVPTVFGEAIVAPEAPERTGYTFTGWTPEVGNMDDVSGKTYTATWQIKTYTLTLAMGEEDADTYYEQTFEFGAEIPAIEDPVRRGYKFEGWSNTIPTTMPAQNVFIYANWSGPISYSIKWYVNDELYKEESSPCDRNIFAPDYEIPEGHTFSGWMDEEGNVVTWFFMPDHDVEIHATLTVNTYTVTWKIGDQTWTTEATYGKSITEPAVIVPENYYSYKWTTEIPETMPADENLTIEGYWTAKLMVLDEDGNEMAFASGGLSYYPQVKIAKVGETAYANYRGTDYMEGHTLYLVNVADETERYEITYASGATVYPSVPMTQNKTLQLTAVIKVYSITWKNADEQILASTGSDWNTTPAFPEGQTPVYPAGMKEEGYNYTFIGWSDTNGGEMLDTLPAVTEDATYYAVYEKTAKSFLIDWMVKDYDGEGTEAGYRQTSVKYGEPITAPTMIWDKEGHTFSGWQAVPATMPAENIVIYGEFTVNSYTVTFTVDGEVYGESVTVKYGEAIPVPTAPTKEGHTFSGWDVPTAMPAKSITLEATLIPNTYTVTWIADGETFATTEATFGQAIVLPENVPTKTGYTFSNWVNVPETMPDNENLTIEAAFTANLYQVSWFANGGSFKLGNIPLDRVGSNVAYDSPVVFTGYNLPIREGYTFTGWNTKADGTGDPLTAETVMNTTDNMTVYYAQWKINTYTVTWDVDGVKTEETYEWNEVPDFTGSTDKAQVGCTVYTFAGWDKDIVAVTEDVTYTATYTTSESHTEDEPVVENNVAPDCENEGSYDTVVYCSVCDAELSRETTTVDALGHTKGDPVVEKEVAADCENNGSYDTVVYCSVCDAELSRVTTTVDALGHTKGDVVVENNVAPDCENEGSYDNVTYCTVCGDETSRETITVDALGHTPDEPYEEVRVEPECTTDGYFVMVTNCAVCNDELSRVTTPIAAPGHGNVDGFGYETNYDPINTHMVTCEDCGETTVDEEGCTFGDDHICDYCEAVERMTVIFMNGDEEWTRTYAEYNGTLGIAGMPIPEQREGHTFGWYTEGGVHVAHGMTVTENLVAYATWTINTYTVIWNVDGVETKETYEWNEVPAFSGSTDKAQVGCTVYTFAGWDKDIVAVTEDVTYTATYTTSESHTEDEPVVEKEVAADCENNGSYDTVVYCSVCKKELSRETTIVDALGHTKGDVVVENNVAPDCENEGSYDNVTYCTVCGDETSRDTITVDALGHTKGDPVVEKEVAADCENNGSYDTVVYCSVCKKELSRETTIVDALGHSYEAVVTDPTCTEAGYTTYICSVCGDTYVADEVEALGHTAGDVVVENNVAPDCENEGSYDNVTYCTVCGNETSRDTITVDALGHTKGDPVVEKEVAADCENDGSYDTVVYCSVCKKELSRDTTTVPAIKHDWQIKDYSDITETQHTVNYICANDPTHTKSETVDHDYKNEDHKCECGDVEKFTITWIIDGVEQAVEVAFNTLPEAPEATKAADDTFTYTFAGWDKEIVAATEDIAYTAIFTRTGWLITEEGAQYLIEDQVQKTGWTEIGDAWYYLYPETGYAATGVARVPYPETQVDGKTYAPDQASIDYAASKGESFIDEDTGLFIFGEDGKFQSNETGIDTYLDATRYAENGHIAWHPGLVQSGDDYYYFIGDANVGGNIMATGDIYISRNNTQRDVTIGGCYTFGADGKLCEYDGITDVDGVLRYYEDAQLMLGNGLTQVGDQYIYVRSGGQLVVDNTYWVPANDMGIEEGVYSFDGNGFLIIPEPIVGKSGVYMESGNWVYYLDGAKQYNAGLILLPEGTVWYDAKENAVKTADGEGYVYVRSNAQLATGEYWITNTNGLKATGKYTFDTYGLIQEQKNGIVAENGGLYYYVDNQIQYAAGVIEIDGNYYYVRSNGALVTGRTYWITNVGDSGVLAKAYAFDENGVMQNPEFEAETEVLNGIVDGYYYVDGEIAYGAGLVEHEGGYIYVKSSGQIATGEYWATNNNGLLNQGMYDFGATGILYV